MHDISLKLENFTTHLRQVSAEQLLSLPEGAQSEQMLWVAGRGVWQALTGPNSTPALRAALAPIADRVLLIDGDEPGKTWEAVTAVLERGFALGLARDAWIVGIGGGVVTDLCAFAASLYMRGCKLLLIPTTVLAQVDATLGGKTGINFGGHKNMVGTFYPAHEIRIVPELLASLPEAEYRGGLAEVIKHAFLVGGPLFELIRDRSAAILSRDPSLLPDLIWDSLMVKARVVEADLREKGPRAHLNLGHTFGHGLEAVAGFGVWNHGNAVAWGMGKAARLSVRLGLAPAAYQQTVEALLDAYGYAREAPGVSVDALIAAMLLDKKKQGGAVRFILQRGIGDTLMQAVAEADLRAVLGG